VLFWWLIGALHILPFATRPALLGGDEPHYALMTHSLAVDHDVDLSDDYAEVAEGSMAAGRKFSGTALEHHEVSVGNRRVFSHPLGLPLLAALPLTIATFLGARSPDLILGLFTLFITFLALRSGVKLMERDWGAAGVFAALFFYFSTPLWFYSRTFFTEPYLAAAVVFFVTSVRSNRYVAAGIFAAAMLWLKESSVVMMLPMLIWALRGRTASEGMRTIGPIAFASIAFIAKNVVLYGEPFVTFQPFATGDLLANVATLTVSSSKSILFFAPLFVVGAVAALMRRGVALWLAVAVVAHLLLVLFWTDPGGGWCYGPRLIVPALPLAVPLLAEAWRDSRWRRVSIAVAFFGWLVQFMAATHPHRAFGNVPVHKLLITDPAVLILGIVIGALALRFGGRVFDAPLSSFTRDEPARSG
jgi:hypothetical protein